jgi:hypothetical protein
MRSATWLSIICFVGLEVSLAVAKAPGGLYELSEVTVKDTRTGLVWQRLMDNSACGGDGLCTFDGARDYCAALQLGGSGDWRVPNMKELQTIVDETEQFRLVDSVAFPNIDVPPVGEVLMPGFTTGRFHYWTSTKLPGQPDRAGAVYFASGGGAIYFEVTRQFRVRCVR